MSVNTEGSVEPARFSLDARAGVVGLAVLRVTIGLVWMAESAGRAYGIDGVLRPHWLASAGRGARLLARLS